MKQYLIIIIVLLLVSLNTNAQDRYKAKEKAEPLSKIAGIEDRAIGTHNASNIGLFFENRGKLYPRRATDGPSGEFPINSTKNYIYRIAPFVGIPGNVVQSRHTGNEEWEAVGGYHNDEFANIAFSDNPQSWHQQNGWPVKDANGDPIFFSDQDSYCVFADSNNAKEILGLHVAQTGYAYGVEFAEDMIFFKYEIWNEGSKDLDDVYFAMYTDIDVGNVSGGDPEYGDDLIGFDNENDFLYFYDDGISNEWPGGTTGYFGISFLGTPEVNNSQLGITDMHYYLWDDDENNDFDTLQYGIMSSDPALFNSSVGNRYFHLGSNFPNLNYDDPATIRSGGDDLVATVSSGPYKLNRSDTLTFYIAIMGGEDQEDIYKSLEVAQRAYDFNFELSKAPTSPNLTASAGDNEVILYWDDSAESSFDNFSQENDFEGYRLYKSIDKGITWQNLGDFNINSANGLQYSYQDNNVTNGFEYWYSVTAYDKGSEEIASLESPKGNTPDVSNLVEVVPKSAAIGYIPVSSTPVQYVGSGISNYDLIVDPVSDEKLAGSEYEIGFTYVSRNFGTLTTDAEFIIKDSSLTNLDGWAFNFISDRSFELTNLKTDTVVLANNPTSYLAGAEYPLIKNVLNVKFSENSDDPFYKPKTGDIIKIYFGSSVVKNQTDTVVAPRRVEINQLNATPDGVVYSFKKPELISNVSFIGTQENVEIKLSVIDEELLRDETYILSILSSENEGNENANITIEIKDMIGNAIDTMFNINNFNSISFAGLSCIVSFDVDNLPANGTLYSITTVTPKQPTLEDRYKFSINSAMISKAQIAEKINTIKVVPNPYVAASLYEPEFGELRREPERQIQFINLPNSCTIYIYTIDADLIRTINHDAASGTATWDLKGDGGREIASGIYIYVVKTDGEEFMSRFAIIK